MRINTTTRVSLACSAYFGLVAAGSASNYTAYVPVCCNANSTVSIVGTANNKVEKGFTAGPGSYALAIPTRGIAWVANANNDTISVVNMSSGVVAKTLALSLQPWAIKASPDGTRIYVVTGNFTGSLSHFSSNLLAFDTKTYANVGSVALTNDGLINAGLVVSPDGTTVYATLDSQNIGVYNVAANTLTATWETSRALVWTATGTLTISADGTTLYTSGQEITAFDTATGAVRGTVNPPGPARTYSFVGSAISADGSTLYATFAAQIGVGGYLAVIDTASMTVTSSTALGVEPQQPILSADGSTLYVPDALDSVLYVVSTATLTTSTAIALLGDIATATLSSDGSALYVPNTSTAATLAVDPASLAVIGSIGVGASPTAPSATANGRSIYVGGIATNNVSEISAAKNIVAREFANSSSNPSVTGPNSPALLVTPNGRQVYLGTNSSQFVGAIPVIETATGTLSGVTCPDECYIAEMVALPNSSRIYVSGSRPFGDDGAVPIFYVIDTATRAVIARSTTAKIGPMAASPSGSFLYIATSSGIQIFDTATNAVTGTLPITGIYGIAFSPNGATAYAVSATAVELIDTATGLVTGSISLGSSITPLGITVSPDGTQVWVTPASSNSVIVVNPVSATAQSVNLGATVYGVAFGVP
jgi:DNA-binding beta-propeller fold protein YncE